MSTKNRVSIFSCPGFRNPAICSAMLAKWPIGSEAKIVSFDPEQQNVVGLIFPGAWVGYVPFIGNDIFVFLQTIAHGLSSSTVAKTACRLRNKSGCTEPGDNCIPSTPPAFSELGIRSGSQHDRHDPNRLCVDRRAQNIEPTGGNFPDAGRCQWGWRAAEYRVFCRCASQCAQRRLPADPAINGPVPGLTVRRDATGRRLPTGVNFRGECFSRERRPGRRAA